MPALPPAFLARPIAHRALHDRTHGRPENSLEAVQAAIEQGYGIEIDLQLARDGQAMVFHDRDLDRLTGSPGRVRDRDSAELADLPLLGGETGIPTLPEILALVAGRVPLLIELKDQSGLPGAAADRLERATASALDGYAGDVALMSFNPRMVAHMATLAPDRPRGLTTCAFREQDWPHLPEPVRAHLRAIPDAATVGAGFISHEHVDLDNPRVAELKAQGLPILCWTIKTPEQETAARRIADNVTFEGYAA